MQPVRMTGPGSGVHEYDILTALAVAALHGSTTQQVSALRLIALMAARYNWQRNELSIGQAVLDRLASDAPEDFANWYRRLQLAGCEGGAVRLAAPNAFVSSYVATHLAAPLEAEAFGAGVRVALVAG